ncbi:MAG TPA: ABC transporter substrate-binding protein [Nitriliruptorales bacterium]|nr:ABC transporter substrate-binding protein [Nitriliruptorales bacterium]
MRARTAWTVVAFALVTAACQAPDEDVAPAPTATVTETETEAARGGTLVVAITADPGHLNPAITTSGGTHTASELLYNGLLAVEEEGGEPVGDLAEDWEVEEDGAVYRFTLRDGVTWHDGEPFTSADVKFSFEQVLLQYHARTKASLASVLEGIDTPDERTVVFRFNQPYAPFLLQLDVTEAPIVAEHVYAGSDPNENPANTDPVGTGPFEFVSYQEGAEIRLARNDDYFKEDLPYLDEVVMRVVPDDASALLALEDGEVDFLWGVPGPDLERIRTADEIVTGETASNPGGSNCIMTISFNLDRPVLADQRVRQAIAHALDRQRFLDQILFGQGEVAEAPISSGIAWAHADQVDLPEHDVAEAERLLDEAGWKDEGGATRVARGVEGVEDGTPLRIDFLHFPTFSKYGELVREQLGAVSIEVALRPLEPPVFAPTVFAQDDFDSNVISYCNGPDPEIGVRRMYDSAQIGDVPFTNAAHYRNPEVDALFQQAVTTIDRDERADAYRQIQEQVARDLPYVWLVETESTRAWQDRCTGFKIWTGLFAETASCRS